MRSYIPGLVIAAVAMLGSSDAAAQAITPLNLRARIPFTFSAGGREMPAGEYVIAQQSPTVFRMLNPYTKQSVFVYTPVPLTGQGDGSKIVFRCSGDACSVGEIWMSNNNGFGRMPTAREREERRASNQPEKVAVVRITRG